MAQRTVNKGDWYIDAQSHKPVQAAESGTVEILDGTQVRRIKTSTETPSGTPENKPEESKPETPEANEPSEVAAEDPGEQQVVEITPEADTFMTQQLLNTANLLSEIEPDGTDDGEMIRGCTVHVGDVVTGHDGKHYVVLQSKIGNGKWDLKSGTKILRWKPEVVKKIDEMGFSLMPGQWKNSIKAQEAFRTVCESLMLDAGYIRNDIFD